jgi:hypothetical protein
MTDEQINVAIAEACPKVHADYYGPVWVPEAHGYTTDLNAMHEAELSLSVPHHRDFRRNLRSVCKHPYGTHFCHATARQRAEAFLRTIGKWTP